MFGGTRKTRAHALLESAEQGAVTMGALVSLYAVEADGYLLSEGFTESDCSVAEAQFGANIPATFEDCVFKIVPKYKYDAHHALNEALDRLNRDRSSIQSAALKQRELQRQQQEQQQQELQRRQAQEQEQQQQQQQQKQAKKEQKNAKFLNDDDDDGDVDSNDDAKEQQGGKAHASEKPKNGNDNNNKSDDDDDDEHDREEVEQKQKQCQAAQVAVEKRLEMQKKKHRVRSLSGLHGGGAGAGAGGAGSPVASAGSSSSAAAAATTTMVLGIGGPGDGIEEELLRRCELAELSERNENQKEYERMAGKNITYGQAIQLQHVKSGKFVTITVKEIAELEKHCLKVTLDEDGNEGSCFVVSPRFKVRSEGEPVMFGDQLLLQSKTFSTYLHVSTNQFLDGRKEVNAHSTLSRVSWRMLPFSPCMPEDHGFLLAGSVVRLYHKETDAYLTNERRHPDEGNLHVFLHSNSSAGGGGGDDLKFGDSLASASSASLSSSSASAAGASSSSSSSSSSKAKRRRNAAAQNQAQKNSNSLWMLERERSCRGGVARQRQPFRFKHLATGRYLALRHVPPTPAMMAAAQLAGAAGSTSGDHLGAVDDRLSDSADEIDLLQAALGGARSDDDERSSTSSAGTTLHSLAAQQSHVPSIELCTVAVRSDATLFEALPTDWLPDSEPDVRDAARRGSMSTSSGAACARAGAQRRRQ
jgi:Inositol 1,4,5-trisphosphate/ryanodine receptor/MIR domain